MKTPPVLMRPEELWPRTLQTTRAALASGALQPIATECHAVEQHGVPFQVRVLGRARLKDRTKREPSRAAPLDPFENPEPDLVVGDLTSTHLCLLNKFNVVDHHLLIITRAFEEQDALPTAADFEALALGLEGLDGLAFYNSGETAGASQRHKHLQLTPPLGPGSLHAPLEALLPPSLVRGQVERLPTLGFAHVLAGLGTWESTAVGNAARLLETYLSLRAALGMHSALVPYNLLATRDWMLLVPRASASFQGINVNALGFAGSLLVRTPEELHLLKALGPLALLREVAGPTSAASAPEGHT